MITERNYVATRKGLEPFKQQLYAEALQCGMAETVLVVADGAVWIWNLVDDRFKDATSCVDIWTPEKTGRRTFVRVKRSSPESAVASIIPLS